MSASLVRKSLLLVESNPQGKNRFKDKPKQHSSKSLRKTKGPKADRSKSQQTVSDLRKTSKSKEQILKENLKKLETIRSASKVTLDKDLVDQIIKRAVTKRPVRRAKKISKKQQKTAFTEEDFKAFEETYVDQ